MTKRIVIKLGGSSLQNSETLKELVGLIAGYRTQGHEVIVVHGGGPAINKELTLRGISWQFINGQRQTTMEMIDVIEEVLAKQVNSLLVQALNESGVAAVGVSGTAQNMLFCSQSSAELMQVGKIEAVNNSIVEAILTGEAPAVPVIAPIGIGAAGEKYNINADWAAAQIAMALGAEKLIFLTDQHGILNQDSELLHEVTPGLIHKMIDEKIIVGGMYTKSMTMMTALAAGVSQVRVLNASVASQLHGNDELGTLLAEAH